MEVRRRAVPFRDRDPRITAETRGTSVIRVAHASPARTGRHAEAMVPPGNTLDIRPSLVLLLARCCDGGRRRRLLVDIDLDERAGHGDLRDYYPSILRGGDCDVCRCLLHARAARMGVTATSQRRRRRRADSNRRPPGICFISPRRTNSRGLYQTELRRLGCTMKAL